jgi:hypothetical protein
MIARLAAVCIVASLLVAAGCRSSKAWPTQDATMGPMDHVSSGGPKTARKMKSASELPVTAVDMRPPVESGLPGVHKLLVVPLAGPEDASTRATSKLLHYLYNSHRFEILELRDNGDVAKALQTRQMDPRMDPRMANDPNRMNMLGGGMPRMGGGRSGGGGGGGISNQAGGLFSLAGSSGGGLGSGVLSALTGQLLGGISTARRPPDKKTETEFEASGTALTIKDAILKEAKEQGADAILIGEVLNYQVEDIDPRFHLLPREGTGIIGAAVGIIMVPLDMAINVGEWSLNKMGRMWGRVPPAVERTAQVQVACRVIDLKTNRVCLSSEPYQVEVARSEKDTLLPPEGLVLSTALDKCARELVSGMSGAPEMMRMEFVTTSELRAGVDHARQGRMQQARMEFEKVLYENPADHGACYNIGVLEEARGDFELASRYYNAAFAIQQNEKYLAAADRIRARQDHGRELQAQMTNGAPNGPGVVLPAVHPQPQP